MAGQGEELSFLARQFVGGLGQGELLQRCVHFIDKKHNVVESFVWMGICGILVLSFSLPASLKEALKGARTLSLRAARQQELSQQGGGRVGHGSSAVDAALAALCLLIMLCMVVAEAQRQTLVMLLQFPFCVLVSLLTVLAGYLRLKALRPAAIVINVLLLPCIPTALFSLAVSDAPFPPALGPSICLALKAASALVLLLAPVHLLSSCQHAPLVIALKAPYVSPLLGCWYAVQVRWTVCLGVAVFTHANLEGLLCPPESLARWLAPASAWLAETSPWPLYRSALTVLLVVAGAVYSGVAVQVVAATNEGRLAVERIDKPSKGQ